MKSNSTAGAARRTSKATVSGCFRKREMTLNYRFPTLARSLREFAVDTVILDGEVVAVDENGRPDFAALSPLRQGWWNSWAFDLLEVDGRV